MEVKTRKVKQGTEIIVESESDVAIVVEGDEERIYLPDAGFEKSSYYAGEPKSLESSDNSYRIVHRGDIDSLEVFSD